MTILQTIEGTTMIPSDPTVVLPEGFTLGELVASIRRGQNIFLEHFEVYSTFTGTSFFVYFQTPFTVYDPGGWRIRRRILDGSELRIGPENPLRFAEADYVGDSTYYAFYNRRNTLDIYELVPSR